MLRLIAVVVAQSTFLCITSSSAGTLYVCFCFNLFAPCLLSSGAPSMIGRIVRQICKINGREWMKWISVYCIRWNLPLFFAVAFYRSCAAWKQAKQKKWAIKKHSAFLILFALQIVNDCGVRFILNLIARSQCIMVWIGVKCMRFGGEFYFYFKS